MTDAINIDPFWLGEPVVAEWFGVIVVDEGCHTLKHQAGCVSCTTMRAPGAFVPLPTKMKPTDDLCMEGAWSHIDYEHDRIQQIIESGDGLARYVEPRPEGGTAMEAWVDVQIREDAPRISDDLASADAVLVWPNCD